MSASKKIVALILCVIMLASLAVPVFAEDAQKKTTVIAFGDSMSQGYMFTDYNETPVYGQNHNLGHYCGWQGSSERAPFKKLVADMRAELGYENVELIDLTVQGEQPDEICAFLEGYTLDDLESMTRGARKHIGWWVGDYMTEEEQDPGAFIFPTLAEMSSYFIDSVKKADYLVYDIGMNYFGTYLTDMRDADEVFTDFIPDESTRNAVEELRAQLHSYLGEQGMEAIGDRINGILYAYASYIYYTERALDDVFALNPDVEVILVPLSNPHRELYLDLGGIKICYSDIIDIMFKSLNDYMTFSSRNRSRINIAQLDAPVISFADELYYYPDDLSADAQALVEKTVFGYGSVLGYETVKVPEAVAESFWNSVYTFEALGWPGPVEGTLMLYYGLVSYADPETGECLIDQPSIDRLIWNYIVENYGEETAFNDFYGSNFADFMAEFIFVMASGGMVPSTIVLDDSIMADTLEADPNYFGAFVNDFNVSRARAAVENGTAKDFQKHLVEALGDLLDNWTDLAVKAATYRTMPVTYLTGEIDLSILNPERIAYLLQNPDDATDEELLTMHAGIRSGAAARGFGAHPCPRGLDQKYYAISRAYKDITEETSCRTIRTTEIIRTQEFWADLGKKYSSIISSAITDGIGKILGVPDLSAKIDESCKLDDIAESISDKINPSGKSIFEIIAYKMERAGIKLGLPTHVLKYVAHVDASCDKDGCKGYWKCEICGACFSDAFGKREISDLSELTVPASHRAIYVLGKGYYHCIACGENFEDAGCTAPVVPQKTAAELTSVDSELLDAPGAAVKETVRSAISDIFPMLVG